MVLILANVDRLGACRPASGLRDGRAHAASLPGQEWAPAYDNAMTAAVFAA
jgi:hypothetical protein